MASASITITITDSTVTLIDMRDTLCDAWGYAGSPSDNPAKLAFIKSTLIQHIKEAYNNQKINTIIPTVSQAAQGTNIS